MSLVNLTEKYKKGLTMHDLLQYRKIWVITDVDTDLNSFTRRAFDIREQTRKIDLFIKGIKKTKRSTLYWEERPLDSIRGEIEYYIKEGLKVLGMKREEELPYEETINEALHCFKTVIPKKSHPKTKFVCPEKMF